MASGMKRISTHILDLALGKPAPDVPVRLERQEASGGWHLLASAQTDRDGRCSQLLPETEDLSDGLYRLAFDTASHYRSEEHTSELQSQSNLVCRLLLEKKKNI